MNRKLLITVIAFAIVIAAAFAGAAYAKAGFSPTAPFGQGMMGRGWGSGMMGSAQQGVMHDAMFDALADGLGITREELDERTSNGETPYEVAPSLGFTEEEFASIHEAARQTAMQQMVDDGAFTQEQADWMLNHMSGTGYGPGTCPHFNNVESTTNG